MSIPHRAAAAALALLVACSGTEPLRPPPAGAVLAVASGNGQTVAAGSTVTLAVSVVDAAGAPLSGITVSWLATGGGTVPSASTTGADGVATAPYTAATTAGAKTVTATIPGLSQSAVFTVTVTAAAAQRVVRTAGEGQTAPVGQPLAVPLTVTVVDAFGNGVAGQAVTWTVTAGSATVAPARPVTDSVGVAGAIVTTQPPAGQVVVTASAAGLGGSPVTFTAIATIPVTLAAQVPIPANYGLHDQFVRDGLAFLCAWNTGLLIYDVGNGMRGGSPANPVLVSSIVTAAAGVPGGAQVHNAWWYHAPNGDKRYVFVGQEGPGAGGIGVGSSGDIHVVDIANINNPVEVASYHLAGAGTHNFWVDEPAQILYAAYYNGGVVALDISGTLSGNLASREIGRLQPGGAGNTYVWGVMLAGGHLYASDMLSGLWQLQSVGGALSVVGGGNNVPERFGSDLWVANGYAYTGTWGTRFTAGNVRGNAVKVWRLTASGAPVPADSVVLSGVGTVSDVEVSADGRLLVFSTENGPNAGIWFYSLAADPAHPVLLGSYLVGTGVHTATIAEIGGRRYVFASKDPGSPSLLVLDVTSLGP